MTENMRIMARQLIRAQKRANETGKPFAVVSLDQEEIEGRELAVCPLEYTETDEFAAFDGKIWDIVEPAT